MKKKNILYLAILLIIILFLFILLNPADFIQGFREGLNAAGR